MVYRIFVEKRKALANEAASLLSEIKDFLKIDSITDLRILNRYDAENITEELFETAVKTVFSEPQTDLTYKNPTLDESAVFAVEYLPGQFDQRADSAAQCIQLISCGDRPTVRAAKVYVLYGDLKESEIEAVKKYVINPVDSREASLELPKTLNIPYDIPDSVAVMDGFTELDENGLQGLIDELGLAMDLDDIKFCQRYFISEKRNPTITEIRMADTYWSDHCRHTTFLTIIDSVKFEDEIVEKAYNEYLAKKKELGKTSPICLMDIATLAAKALKADGRLTGLDESDEINACTVKINVTVDGREEPWLLLFKNETHNHPTEVEPFGGAATCIGGAIRDPLSGRAYVYGAMRVTGAADPLKPVEETIKGKLPQRKIVTGAAAGYSSYGNQIGLATGIVDELYHDGYAAKRMEIGAVVAAAPEENVRREKPVAGDIVILLGGATGRDGIGGATGSSKAHTVTSVEKCGAEVQKGNAPEERKLQRLFRRKDACNLIKKCNDFGAGGVSVAIGELADGLEIELDKVPKKYEGLDGTELAISESQERMAVVVDKNDADKFIAMAKEENLSATPVAVVTEKPRLVMNWNGKKIVDISRSFLDSNGAEKHIEINAAKAENYKKEIPESFSEGYKLLLSDLNVCSKRGLSERFDSTIGAGTVIMPFGGKNQLTPAQAMVQKVSVEKKHTDTCSLMAWGYNPFIAEQSPYHGAYLAVVESVSKLIASGASFKQVYLTFQEYFEHPGSDSNRWGKPLSALLGAYKAQLEFGIGSVGGKDSMSGSFEDIDVPPTLVSFAVTTEKTKDIVSGDFKKAGSKAVLIAPEYDENSLPKTESLIEVYNKVNSLVKEGKAYAIYTPSIGGIAEAVFKMCIGNGFGFKFSDELSMNELFGYNYGSFIVETDDESIGRVIGTVESEPVISYKCENADMTELLSAYEDKLESVYPSRAKADKTEAPIISFETEKRCAPSIKCAKPRILIPAFPGTNCEYDTAKAAADAGLEPEIFVINNMTRTGILNSVETFAKKVKESQIVFIPGGFSGGDEPDGSGKFITAFFRNADVKEAVGDLLDNRDGLMAGICNGFQALIKLGLVPFGKIIDADETCPTLTFNTIGRHQSRIVRTRVASNKSPWLAHTKVGEIYNVPVSHGEGRFIASDELLASLIENGQIATQYADLDGNPTLDIDFNVNGSFYAIEGITSPDGRVLGKMGHSERIGEGLYMNVPGEYDMKIFKSAFEYFK
ncbi:MAG: phosphoribosylformylglycinamidine synthase [Ruminococcaceae bacterium]|nr:phosphoribosylformylglycinamidine synthase [Oscillospiraceae bacterium]